MQKALYKIELGIEGLTIEWDGSDRGCASITSSMYEKGLTANHPYNAAVCGIESLILAHFCAGMDVLSLQYLSGINTACEAITNKLYDDAEVLMTTSEFYKLPSDHFNKIIESVSQSTLLSHDWYFTNDAGDFLDFQMWGFYDWFDDSNHPEQGVHIYMSINIESGTVSFKGDICCESESCGQYCTTKASEGLHKKIVSDLESESKVLVEIFKKQGIQLGVEDPLFTWSQDNQKPTSV